MKHRVKLGLDVCMGILFVIQLGYYLVGGALHEVAGSILLVCILIHNIWNIKWYKQLHNGNYNKKRILNTIINLLLDLDMLIMAVSGVCISNIVFKQIGNGIAAQARPIHSYAAIVGVVLVLLHIAMHLYKGRKNKRKLVVVVAIILILCVVAYQFFGMPYLERHFKTVSINISKAVQGEQVPLGVDANEILIAYFTWPENTVLSQDVDAVSMASLLKSEEGLVGNSQVLARMVQNAVGGTLYSIERTKKYSPDYNTTVKEAKEELNAGARPELKQKVATIEEYQKVFLIVPVWWGTIPMPVATFLEQYDFSGKELYLVATHGGGGVSGCVSDVKKLCKADVPEQVLSVYCSDISGARKEVTEWLKKVVK